jgi:hypothetical protein
MPKQKKTWILVKGCEYRPQGALSLGQILTKPSEPSLPLLADGPLAVPEANIERSYQASVELTSHTTLEGSFKIWADVSILPVRGEVGSNTHKSQSLSWHFDRLETEIMVPRLSDVRTAISKDEVVAQINRNKFDFRKRLYMITGVRIARGARLVQSVSKAVGGVAKVGVDLTALTAAPLSVGPAAEISKTSRKDYSFNDASDFVYAYRVCEVHYGKDVYTMPYNRGDTFRLERDNELQTSSEDEEDEEENPRVFVEKIDESDYTGSDVPHRPFVSEGENGEQELILWMV